LLSLEITPLKEAIGGHHKHHPRPRSLIMESLWPHIILYSLVNGALLYVFIEKPFTNSVQDGTSVARFIW
jgi:hypothetical protein